MTDAGGHPAELAPAKINLTLRVVGRRADGYHELESFVVFADFGDRLSFAPGGALALTVNGPTAVQAGDGADNLVLKAARALAGLIPGLVLGNFHLEKQLPVAAGIGGGSADAAAALRLLARANGLAADDPRLYAAARATGADVPVCLDPRPRVMRGVGELLSDPLSLPPLPAVLVNPGTALSTKSVFAGWTPAAAPSPPLDPAALQAARSNEELIERIRASANDLEVAAIGLAPVIAEVLADLRALEDCHLARMSGSGSTCFGLFATGSAADAAANILSGKYPHWWIKSAMLG